MADLSTYPYKATRDARSAMAAALAKFVGGVRATFPRRGESFGFLAVYDSWASFNERAMSAGGKLPAAAVLPDRPIYDESALTPRMIEETWSGGDPCELRDDGVTQVYPIGDGSGDGFALFAITEMVVPFVLLYRATSKPQRSAFAKRLEEVFVEDGGLFPDPSSLNPDVPLDEEFHPVRYGRVIEVPAYYSRKARFSLQSQQVVDSTTSAAENRWVGQVELTGSIQVCVLRRVRAMTPQVRLVVNGAAY